MLIASRPQLQHRAAADMFGGTWYRAYTTSQAREPDKQQLIERIVSLQRAAARRAERTEFLEEHSRQLTHELRNKGRVLRALLCETPRGLASDEHKVGLTDVLLTGLR